VLPVLRDEVQFGRFHQSKTAINQQTLHQKEKNCMCKRGRFFLAKGHIAVAHNPDSRQQNLESVEEYVYACFNPKQVCLLLLHSTSVVVSLDAHF